VPDLQRPLPLLATRDLILFPKMLTSIFVGREKSVRALEQAYTGGTPLILSAQKSASVEEPDADDIERVGTLATVVQFSRLTDGTVKALIEGQSRVTIDAFASVMPHFSVQFHLLEDRAPRNQARIRALMEAVAREFAAYVSETPELPEEAETVLDSVTEPGGVVDIVAAHLLVAPDR
jgi:ATP-dependent Lon protease